MPLFLTGGNGSLTYFFKRTKRRRPALLSADPGGVSAAAFRLVIRALSLNLQVPPLKRVKVVPQQRQESNYEG